MPATLRVYAYQGCSTCKTALKWLKQQGLPFTELAIRETPPTVAELRTALDARSGDMRPLFNVSGQDYRALGLKDTLPTMKADAALELLASNGNLVKRPFVVDAKSGVTLVGFKEVEWQKALVG